jgi:hypothetical protein
MENYKNLSLEDLENEIWIDALGYDGIYHVSNLGRIKSIGRWVSNGKSERFVKEKIRKQVLVSDGRLTCPLSTNNKPQSINVSALIYFSFNSNKQYLSSKYCVMHKNKIAFDNKIENLELTTISKSHSINHVFGKLEHLHKYNKQRSVNYKLLKEKKCKICNDIKSIKMFEDRRNTCLKCRGEQKKNRYLSKKESEVNNG